MHFAIALVAEMESMLLHRGSEEKVKHLKRGNAELATIAVKHDEKLKHQRQDSMKKCMSVNASADRTGIVTKGQSVKIAADKDHIIESLREKCQEFSRIFSVHQNVHVQVADSLHIYTDITQLEVVLQQAAKERLQLEKRLVASEVMDAAVEAQLDSVKSIKMSNSRLEAQLSQMADELRDKEKLEVEVMQRRIEVGVLKEDMEVVQRRCCQLEKEIGEILSNNTELNTVNSDLQKQVDELGKCTKKLTEQNKQLEAEKHWYVEQLQLKQLECDSLKQAKDAEKASVSHLKDQVATLEQQCLDLKTDKLEMLMEMEQMKQHYEQQLLSYHRSSIYNGIDANHNMNNHASDLPLHASDYLHVKQSSGSANGRNITGHNQTSGLVENIDITQSKADLGASMLFHEEWSIGNEHSDCVRVFVVLYDYDPYQSSPNDQPDIELPISAGEHVFIMGDVDEDGFYSGTLTDGRSGLVPSNFVRELHNEEDPKMNEMETLQMLERFRQMVAGGKVQGIDDEHQFVHSKVTDDGVLASCPLADQQDISSDVSTPCGDHVLLEDSDLCHAGAPQFVSTHTRTTSGRLCDDSQPVCLSPQWSSHLHSNHVQSSGAAHHDVTMPSVISMMSSTLPCDLSSNRDSVARHRPLSEPSVFTDLCLKSDMQKPSHGSVELMKRTNVDGFAQQMDVCATVLPSNQSHNMQGYGKTAFVTGAGSNLHTMSSSLQDDYPMQDVPRISPLLLKQSYVNNISGVVSTMIVKEEYQSKHVPADKIEPRSVWRKVEPRHLSEQGNIKSVLSSESAVSNHVDGFVASHSDDKDFYHLHLPSDSDMRETKVDAEDSDSSHGETGYDLTDNNVVTAHQLRDNIPDSELIDYSDDGGESLIDSITSSNVTKDQVRIFVALFDYDPATMSPNPDAVESELPFTEGQLIKVLGDTDADGFYYGECNGQRGLVPSNIIAEVEVDDAEAAIQLLHDSCPSAAPDSSITSSRTSSQTGSYIGHQEVSGQFESNFTLVGNDTVHYMVAMYSYNPIELSPNIDADQELAFSRGDIIAVYGDADDDGFYFGELDGRSGLVPSNFLKEAPLGFSVS